MSWSIEEMVVRRVGRKVEKLAQLSVGKKVLHLERGWASK